MWSIFLSSDWHESARVTVGGATPERRDWGVEKASFSSHGKEATKR